MNIKQKFTMFADLKHVKRWAGAHTNNNFNVLEHTARVSLITQLICNELLTANAIELYDVNCAMRYALFHDTPETLFNDVNSKTKKDYPELNAVLKLYEVKILNNLIDDNNDISKDPLSKFIVKAADILDCWYEAKCEIKTGNSTKRLVEVANGDNRIAVINAFEEYYAPYDGKPKNILEHVLNIVIEFQHGYI